ncbi:MAG: tryptophan synthase subunit alpha [Candidatus Omnitrophica bacterium]|nr:tryptophan synthase subunit alpha [Candidatus Omnitrophota bacterium]
MTRIDKKFRELAKGDKKAFIAYITAGDPNLAMTEKTVLALERSGVDILELGIPFSDSLADGPTIQAASQRALRGKATLGKIFKSVKTLRDKTNIPIAFMTYYNPVLKYGLHRFIKDCRGNGVDGVIVPDLPFEEAEDLVRFAKRNGVATIFLAAPTSTRARLRAIVKNSRGFIYYVSLTGVTGARKTLPEEIGSKVRLIKSMTSKPVCVGFGVSGPAQAKEIAEVSDGVIVGSALVKVIGEKGNLISRVSKFASNLARAIHSA